MTARITCPRSQLWAPATRPSHLRPRYPQLHDRMLYWGCPDFGTAGNRLLDVSGHRNHGSLENMDWTTDVVAGPYGSLALDFDGASGYVDTGAPLFAGGSYGLSYWMRCDDTSGEAIKTVIGQRATGSHGGLWGVRSGQFLATHIGIVDWLTGVSVTQGQWYHVTWSYDGTSLLLYVDGVLRGSRTLSYTPETTHTSYIGTLHYGASTRYYFPGAVTDLMVWDRPVASSDAKLLASRPLIAGEAIRVPMVSVPAAVTSASAWFFRNQIMRRGRACAS